ncbi:hypothetical protein ACFPPE_03600 [Agromyces tardus]|nr:hypothetical protein [Agromyces tardus]
MTASDFEASNSVYGTVAARRLQWDNLLWQVPVLSLTAQAFLFTIALGGDTATLARLVACSLSLLVTILTVGLMGRHRQAELTDAHLLRDLEADFPEALRIHGEPWRKRRNETRIDAGLLDRVIPMWPMYKAWTYGLLFFGAAAIGVAVVAVAWPDLLQGASGP